ncbi:ribosomal RNA small subunit methyltransferase A [bacterium]|nr:ribosomal RNA small subunit methyltransferase A [bacterium]
MFFLPSNFHSKKRFGQNFLIDRNILTKILRIISLTKDDLVLEIGPGQGILTKELSKEAKKVIAVELDKKLYDYLKVYLKGFRNIKLINNDILKFNLGEFLRKAGITKKLILVGNIPYSITSPILEYLFRNIELFRNIYLMTQREFALRLIAKPNTKDYSSISCFAQFHTSPKILFSVKRTCFRPKPKVDSCFIELEPKASNFWSKDLRPKDLEQLFKIIRAAFNQRRKNILNSLAPVVNKKSLLKMLAELNIDWHLRAENISVKDYIRISKRVSPNKVN